MLARMAQTATKVLQALKDPRATKAMPVLTELALQIKVLPSLSLSQPLQLRQVQQQQPPPQVVKLGRKDPLDRLELQARFLAQLALQDLPTLAYKPSRGRSGAYRRSTCFNPSPNLYGRLNLGRRAQTS